MMIAAPRLLQPPVLLGRAGGVALVHWGVVDGPNGLSLVVEAIDEGQAGVLQEGAWKEPGVDAVQILAAVTTGQVVQPKVTARTTGPGWQRWTTTFGRYGGLARASIDDIVRIIVTAQPIDLTTTINLA
ncbi:hypothetical protein GCM10027280_02610 [Micromonospora polyrhachis]|uniref:Uncharacterized protein n=1 Tax=Micromonospora polyrhachis TaxID=1282883 RepID=A0A7W7SMC8_9ACTN|nr:hypothetical protein [Micromonospora polyrhachis]MBB4957443.1 hypothetical protein [Micromonospora polyrhachis]